MRQLLLLRHAKAVWDQSKLGDRERPLSPQGERAADAVGRAMASLGLKPEFVLSSPAVRALQTLAHLALPGSSIRIASPEPLYLASAKGLVVALQSVPDVIASVLIVGHNPGLYELAKHLLAPDSGTAQGRLGEGFPTATLAEFALSVAWRELGGGTARLVRLLSERDLAGIGARGAGIRGPRS